MLNNSTELWRTLWSRHMATYQNSRPRQADYLSYILRPNERRLLELGSGSFRDIAALGERGYDVLGSDFSPEAVEAGQQAYAQLADRFSVMDATALPLDDNAVDVTFHNGLFVCIDDDTLIDRMLREQVRVSRRRIVVTVHNGENPSLVADFAAKRGNDPLYDIRFFDRAELERLMGPHVRSLRMYPFGLRKFDRWVASYGGDRRWRAMYRATWRSWPWSRVERIMAVAEC